MLRYFAASCLAGGAYILSQDQHNYVHIWGNGRFTPSGEKLEFYNFVPKQIKNFSEPKGPSMTSLVFGPSAEAGIDKEGKIHYWNKHVMYNVPIEGIDDCTREVQKLDSSEQFVDLKFVNKILFALDKKGFVWQWRFDQSESPSARKIPSLKDIKKIATGLGHFLALDREGNVWSMGDDTYGQCGQNTHSRQPIPPFLQIKYPNPLKIELLPEKAVDIACGKFHSLALLENGEVWGWGRNHKHQLGDTAEKRGIVPTIVSFIPTKINGIPNKKVVKLAAGDMFSVFVTEEVGESEVYGCGLNSRGQLGLGYLTHVTDVIKMQNISNFVYKDSKTFQIKPVGIKDIQCGAEHCLALMDVGVIYSWGANEFGEQGNKKRSIQDRPILLKMYKGKEIVSIAAGDRNSGVIFKE